MALEAGWETTWVRRELYLLSLGLVDMAGILGMSGTKAEIKSRKRGWRGLSHGVHRVAEDREAVALGLQALALPLRVLRRQDVGLGVGHEAEHEAVLAAQARDMADGAVRVRGEPAVFRGRFRTVGVAVAQANLPVGLELLQQLGAAGDELALAVAHGEIDPRDPLEPEARYVRVGPEVAPAVLE